MEVNKLVNTLYTNLRFCFGCQWTLFRHENGDITTMKHC